MNDDDRLVRLVRSALPPVADQRPSRDLWPRVANRTRARRRPSAFDLLVGLLAIIWLALFPQSAWLLAYHL